MTKDVIDHINIKRQQLSQAATNLKKHFVGMDHIIDRVIKDIETWYVMPELLTRPITICLWGMTGVGKTDFVRRLVKELAMYDKYCEIEMSNKGVSNYPWANSISDVLKEYSGIESGTQGVILLDEVQNYRTLDENNLEIRDIKLKDVWLLLSDGTLPAKLDVEHLMSLIWEQENNKKNANGKGGPPVEECAFEDDDVLSGSSYGALNRFKRLVRLKEPIDVLKTWSPTKRKELIKQRVADQSVYEEDNYTKCLIFISGNLDEAYPFARASEESDVAADLFHEMSLRINLIDIKTALKRRFKPEQIARLGNTHVIYPSLSKQTYETIINRKIDMVVDRVKSLYKIKLHVDQSIVELIYNNGVFPTQGTRPVFSTISEVLENPLSNCVLECLKRSSKSIYMSYHAPYIICDLKTGQPLKLEYLGVLDELKKKREKAVDTKALTAVHEAGHAVIYAALFGWCPPQIVSTTASSVTSGFIYTHVHCGAKKLNEYQIAMMLGGTVAEQIVFGKECYSTGCSSDLFQATSLAARMTRKAGMSSYSSTVGDPSNAGPDDEANTDIDGTNDLIEKIIVDQKETAFKCLYKHKTLFKEVAKELLDNKEIRQEKFQQMCAAHDLDVEMRSSEDVYALSYKKMFEDFY